MALPKVEASGQASREELASLARLSPPVWDLSLIEDGLYDTGPVDEILAAPSFVTARRGGVLVGAAAVIDDVWHSTILDQRAARLAVISSEAEAHAAVVEASLGLARAKGWESIHCGYLEGRPGLSAVMGGLGFNELERAVLLTARTQRPREGTAHDIRELGQADVDHLHAMTLAERFGPSSLEDAGIHARAAELEWRTASECPRRGGTILVAHVLGAPVAFLALQVAPRFACLRLLVVSPDWRRRGIGDALMRRAADWIRSAGLPGALSVVAAGNQAARRLHARHAFRETGVLCFATRATRP